MAFLQVDRVHPDGTKSLLADMFCWSATYDPNENRISEKILEPEGPYLSIMENFDPELLVLVESVQPGCWVTSFPPSADATRHLCSAREPVDAVFTWVDFDSGLQTSVESTLTLAGPSVDAGTLLGMRSDQEAEPDRFTVEVWEASNSSGKGAVNPTVETGVLTNLADANSTAESLSIQHPDASVLVRNKGDVASIFTEGMNVTDRGAEDAPETENAPTREKERIPMKMHIF